MKRIALVNPNMSAALMVEIARECAPDNLQIEGLTGSFGASLITCDAELDEAADAVRALAPELARRADAVIVSAFDPGADELGRSLRRPVVGIAEAGMRAAAANGRRFAVVTHTGRLVRRMAWRAEEVGVGTHCVGVLATEGDPIALMAAPAELESGLLALARRAVAELGAEAIVIGGGPLGRSAIALRGKVGVPVIEPIPEAVLRVAEMLGLAGATH